MSTPLKPWEQRAGVQQQQQQLQHQQMLNLNSSAPTMQMMQTPVGRVRSSSGLPQVPPRPGISSYGAASPYSYMGASYPSRYSSSYSYGGMGGYGNYGGMGGYGMGGFGGMYGGMYGTGYGMGPESRFIQLAEESTRPAFQGIESLVRAFGSISMMLDSTFFAVTSSFRAVLGVAENFGQIRSMFGQIWSSFALLRFVNWIYRKVLRLFGVKVVEDLGKEAWSQAINETGVVDVVDPANNTSSWPIFMFLGMIVSAPYFISRLLPPIIDKSNPKNWPEPGRKAIAQYPFQASNAQELSLRPGEEIQIAPKSIQDEMQLSGTGWILAASKPNLFGLVPINYIQLAGVRQKSTTKTSNTHNLKINDISAGGGGTSAAAATTTTTTTKNILNKNVSAAHDPYAEFASVDPFMGSIELAEKHSDANLNSAQNLTIVPATSSQINQINSNELPK